MALRAITLFCVAAAALAVSLPARGRDTSSSLVESSAPAYSSTLILIDANKNYTDSEIVSLACLQGTLAQSQALLYILPSGKSSMLRSEGTLSVTPDSTRACYRDYLDAIVKTHQVTVLAAPGDSPDGAFEGTVDYIRSIVNQLWANTTNTASWGYVRANGSSPDSVAVGVMMCAQQGPGCLLASSAAEAAALEAIGIGQAETSVGKTIREYLMVDDGVRMSSNEIAILQDPTKFPALVDVIAATQGVVWFDALKDLDITLSVLGHLSPPSVVMGWGVDEQYTVETLSSFASGIIAADWAMNTATLSSYPMPLSQLPSAESHHHHDHLKEKEEAVDNRHVVAFVMTDGDNVQWLLNGFLAGGNWYGSPSRGKCPITWTMSPSLAWISPATLSIIKSTATANDSFIGSVSGYSYNYPSMIPAAQLTASVNTTQAALETLQFTTLNILDQPISAATAKNISSNFFVGMSSEPSGDALSTTLYYPFSNYCGLNGSMSVSNGRKQLFASGRFCLWSPQYYNVTTLVNVLQNQPQDPTRAEGYSVVPVHVWSHTVNDVWSVVQQLDPSRFRVVGLDELAAIARERLN